MVWHCGAETPESYCQPVNQAGHVQRWHGPAEDLVAVGEPGTEVTVVWGEHPVSAKPAVEEHRQVQIRAVVAPAPYDARDTYRAG